MTLVLDTSGFVYAAYTGQAQRLTWSDLDPFTQGYGGALFASVARPLVGPFVENQREGKCVGFSDLAPETLAAILRDCERKLYDSDVMEAESCVDGAIFWDARQTGRYADFPPLTVALNDDGKVYLREARS